MCIRDSANTVLKKTFKSIKFDGSNAHQIQQLLNDNREGIIRETFRNKLNLYRNYCNTNQLFQEAKECCRLLGYYIDMPKKGKSLAYNFNLNNFAGTDDEVFDFIPFAFQGVRDFFFVNDNVELENLYKTCLLYTSLVLISQRRCLFMTALVAVLTMRKPCHVHTDPLVFQVALLLPLHGIQS